MKRVFLSLLWGVFLILFGFSIALAASGAAEPVFLPGVFRAPATATPTATLAPTATQTLFPTATQPPAPVIPTSTAPPGGSAPCNCTGPDLDCADFPTHRAAQACFEYCYPQYGDIFRLDGDHDGLACELLP